MEKASHDPAELVEAVLKEKEEREKAVADASDSSDDGDDLLSFPKRKRRAAQTKTAEPSPTQAAQQKSTLLSFDPKRRTANRDALEHAIEHTWGGVELIKLLINEVGP